MSLVLICSRRGHEGLLCKFFAAFSSVAIVAVMVVVFPWPAPSAGAARSDLSVPLGETSAQISYVRNTEGSDAVTDLAGGYYYSALPWQWAATRACIRYSPAGGDYSTSVVKGSSGAYATIGYGRQELNGSCPAFEGDPSWGSQSSLGFQPSNTTSIKAGQVFLVGMMRHVNRPICSDTSAVTNPARPETAYYGSFNIRTAGTIEANFPWVEKDTINTCTGKIDSDGRLIVGDYGKEGERVPTSYVYDSKGNVGNYGGNYVYMYQNNRLVRFDGYMTQNYTDKNGRSCSDDILDIKSDRSDTAWTDPSTGIRYKLKLWGFVNNGSSDSCQAQLSTAESAGLEERFITRERSISYGCLYGSLEQERPVTFAKDIKADASVHGSLTIPQFSYLNASPEGTYGHENWGTPSGLTPTWGGEAVDPQTYTLLAPHDAATVQEAGTSPQAVVNRNTGDVRTSGWFLRNVTCTAGSRGTPLLRRDGTTRLDQSDSVNLDKRTIRLDETQLAEHQDEVAVKCVWHNEYVVGRGRVTLVTVVDGGSAKPNQWTMTATPATEGLFGQKTFTGASGSAAVSKVYTAGGTYTLPGSR